MAATTNPLSNTHMGRTPAPVSKQTFPISGMLTDVHGLEELPPNVDHVACLWLLHPRLATRERMDPVAAEVIIEWNKRLSEGRGGANPRGLIAVSFDQRNHGTRIVDQLANQAWREGNQRHAQDMFSLYQGTAEDTSLLLNYLSAYAFPKNERHISSHLVLGISLGGHAAWHCVLHNPRISAAVVVIGCPDYTSLMMRRAEKSKRQTWTSTNPPGSQFLGSTDFPRALQEMVQRWDPAGFLLGGHEVGDLAADVQQNFAKKTRQSLAGKKILNLSGGADKLVPYACSQQFLKRFAQAIQDDKTIVFEDNIYEEVGHEFSRAMADRATSWICEVLQKEGEAPVQPKDSKI